jgi:sugar/nucleoside kinase (ribokinase family)
MYDLVSIGNPVYDEITTPYTFTEKRILSGCSTNSCLAIRKLGKENVTIIGSVGTDYEEKLINELWGYGIKQVNIKVTGKTGGFKLVYDSRGNRTLDVIAVADRITIQDIPEDCLDTKAILLGPILQEIDLNLIDYIRKNTDALIFLDPQGILREISLKNRIVFRCKKREIKKIIELVDIIKPNEHESKIITGYGDELKAVKKLVEWGATTGIVTLAERGSVLFHDDNLTHIPAFRTEAKDPTGAGDVYAGSFIFNYLKTNDVVESAFFASAAASIKVEHTGPSFPLNYNSAKKRMFQIHKTI